MTKKLTTNYELFQEDVGGEIRVKAVGIDQGFRLNERLETKTLNRENPYVVSIKFSHNNYRPHRKIWELMKELLLERGVDLVKIDYLYYNSQESGMGEAIAWIYKIVLKDEKIVCIRSWQGEGRYVVLNPDFNRSGLKVSEDTFYR